jgi:hypothetical protein
MGGENPTVKVYRPQKSLQKDLMAVRGTLYTSTAPLPMRYTTMGYTSMRYTSTALYFYKQFTQAPNKIFLKHF